MRGIAGVLGYCYDYRMEHIYELTEEQQDAASMLDSRQLLFVNLWLTKDAHGLSQADCYRGAGYSAPNENTANAGANRVVNLPRVQNYIRVMRGESIKRTGLTVEYLDGLLAEMIETNIVDTEGIEDLKELPIETQRSIHSIEYGMYGRKLKSYSRLDLIKLAYQRFGALTDKKELSGPGGGPIELEGLSDRELDARIQRLTEHVADSTTRTE